MPSRKHVLLAIAVAAAIVAALVWHKSHAGPAKDTRTWWGPYSGWAEGTQFATNWTSVPDAAKGTTKVKPWLVAGNPDTKNVTLLVEATPGAEGMTQGFFAWAPHLPTSISPSPAGAGGWEYWILSKTDPKSSKA